MSVDQAFDSRVRDQFRVRRSRGDTVEGREDDLLHIESDRLRSWQRRHLGLDQKDQEFPVGDAVSTRPEYKFAGHGTRSVVADDDRLLLFQSDRAGGFGFTDIWAVYRSHKNDDFDWSSPFNLGSVINSPWIELAANYLFADAGRLRKLFFSSTKPGGFGGPDIYESRIDDLGFETSVNVFELNSPSIETCFWVREDGLEIIFSSNRPNITGDIQQRYVGRVPGIGL